MRSKTSPDGTGRAETAHEARQRRHASMTSILLATDDILTSREARTLLKIGRTKLHELTRRQIVPAYRIGTGRTSALRYRRRDLLR